MSSEIKKTTAAVLALVILCACEGEFQVSSEQLGAADAAYDARLLERSLGEIEAWHKKNKTGLAGSLRKGISASAIESKFSIKECQPNEELKALWSWRNGEDAPVPFVWYHDFLSVEEALSGYNWLRFNPLIRWDPNYIPLFSFEGEWYAVYCGPKKGKAGPIIHFSLEDEPRISYTNLTSYLLTMAEALKSGTVVWINGAMVEDIGGIYQIHQKHNSKAMFPYHVPKAT